MIPNISARLGLPLAVFSVLFVASACDKDQGAPQGSSGTENSVNSVAAPVDASTDGANAGDQEETAPLGAVALTVRYTGPVAAPQPITVDRDPEHCSGKAVDNSLLVDSDTRGLANAVLRLERCRGPRKLPDTVTITNRNCMFEPRVDVAVRGTKLALANADPILHTTHPYVNEKNFFNQSLKPNETTPPVRKLNEPGLVKIKCDVHGWMQGWIVVHDNPYVAKTDAKGQLTIDEVPPGTYDYVLWHEKFPAERKGKVTVRPGGTAQLDIEYTGE